MRTGQSAFAVNARSCRSVLPAAAQRIRTLAMTTSFASTAASQAIGQRDSTARLIERQRIVSQYRMAPLPLVAGLAYCPLFVLALWSTVDQGWLLAWAAARLLVGAARLLEVRRFHLERPQQIATWRRRGLWLLCLDAAVWAAIAPLFLSAAPGLQQTLIVATLIALPAIGALTLFALYSWMAIFTSALLVPAMVVFASWNSAAGWVGVAGSAVLLALLLSEGRRATQRWNELQRLRFENARIAEESRELLQLAEQSIAAKTRFLASVSHELRTPLNGIMGMTQSLLTHAQPDQFKVKLDTIARSARHLRHLIDDLIDLSSASSGALGVRNEPFALATAIHDVVQAQEQSARDKQLRFRLLLPPDLPALVVSDAVRVKQVLHNLLGNAVKFTEQGRVTLEVEHASDRLRFTVRDTGPGIAPEWVPLIFNAFEHYSGRRHGGGLGLGLSISREIARSLDGDVVWQAGVPAGSVFVFTAAAPVATADPGDQVRATRQRLDGRALVVEDDPVNAEVARALLQELGLEVALAADGQDALARLSESAFDVVLMDCEMPQLDGYEATRRWRAIEHQYGDGRHVPIVALTANAVAGDRERCLEFGMDDYLAKPFELSELQAALARVLPPVQR
jgi:signal transduction histidine kinase/ActR/RegA family two-component response regulator